MSYQSRIPADPDYLLALGQAFYNFTYLEWIVVWTIVKLSADGFDSVPKGQSGIHIAKALTNAIDNTTPSLPTELRVTLVKFDESYRAAIKKRNKLFHAHPFTALDGSQQIGGGGQKWPIEELNAATKLFEDVSIMGSEIFHGPLKKERPD